MEIPGKRFVAKWVITYEIIAFLFIILAIWFDEVLDIPHLFLGAESTPTNWKESIFESIVIAIVGAIICYITNTLFERMKYLEGILPICASCKKIRDEKGCWHSIEEYIRDRSEAEFSHGICSECAKILYPELQKRAHSP